MYTSIILFIMGKRHRKKKELFMFFYDDSMIVFYVFVNKCQINIKTGKEKIPSSQIECFVV
jgi:hypothetical protein